MYDLHRRETAFGDTLNDCTTCTTRRIMYLVLTSPYLISKGIVPHLEIVERCLSDNISNGRLQQQEGTCIQIDQALSFLDLATSLV